MREPPTHPSVTFTPLTDTLAALSGVTDASISIGALTVQPGGTGVILAGTGDPNDALDSYYGGGILRSTDGGNYLEPDLKNRRSGGRAGSAGLQFPGEGFAGFAWSTVNSQLVVAAVSQAYEGTLVNAVQPGQQLRGALLLLRQRRHVASGDDHGRQRRRRAGAVWTRSLRPTAMRRPRWCGTRCGNLFVAAVRFHGYYQSADGITWTRMSAQPGAGLQHADLPDQSGQHGFDCLPHLSRHAGGESRPPATPLPGRWTEYNQDQGMWQDQCA